MVTPLRFFIGFVNALLLLFFSGWAYEAGQEGAIGTFLLWFFFSIVSFILIVEAIDG